MSKLESTIFGKMSGSVGNITFNDTEDGLVVRDRVKKNKNRNKGSKAQLAQQKKFKHVSGFAKYFDEGMSKGYPTKSTARLHRIFVKINKKAVACDKETLVTTIDYSKFLITDGDLVPPEVVIKKEDERSVFTVEVLPQELTPLCRDDDDVYILFLDPHLKESNQEIYFLGKRGDAKRLSLSLDPDYHHFMTYSFALSNNKKNLSPSVYKYIDLGYDFLNLNNYNKKFIVSKGGEFLTVNPSDADLNLLKKINKNKPARRREK